MREVIAAVRQAIPDASSKPPAAVLDHVLEALRAAQAKPITAPAPRELRAALPCARRPALVAFS